MKAKKYTTNKNKQQNIKNIIKLEWQINKNTTINCINIFYIFLSIPNKINLVKK